MAEPASDEAAELPGAVNARQMHLSRLVALVIESHRTLTLDCPKQKTCENTALPYSPAKDEEVISRILGTIESETGLSGDIILAQAAKKLDDDGDVLEAPRRNDEACPEAEHLHPFDLGADYVTAAFKEATREAVAHLKSKGIKPAGR